MNDIPWKRISQFEGPEESPGFLLWQVSTKWRRLVEAALAQVGLTHPQFVLLACLGWLTRNQGDVSQVELARYCKMDSTMTSQVLRTLEKKGYIERRLREGNERSKFPAVTESGSRLIAQAIPLVEEVDRHFFQKLGPKYDESLALWHEIAQG
ncbi:MAG: MarR family transcriptional regulator [Verrucomicrobia bacterium]|nr:MarR family transcriptional regulator [Verrucomicrobiota bacterium]